MSMLEEVYTAAALQANAVLDTAPDLIGLPIDIYYPITDVEEDVYGYLGNQLHYNAEPDIESGYYFVTGIYSFQSSTDESYDPYNMESEVYLWDKGGNTLIPRGSKVVIHLTSDRYLVFEATSPPDIIPGNDVHIVRRYSLTPKSGVDETLADDSGS